MSRKAEIVTTVCTLGCALGIGYVMQSDEVAQQRYGSAVGHAASAVIVGEAPVVASVVPHVETNKLAPLNVKSITLTSAQVPASAIATSPAALLGVEMGKLPDCGIETTAKPVAGAMISLHISAPCFPNTRVLISHEGLAFTEVLSETGALSVFVPALAKDAVIKATFATGESIETGAEVDSLALYDRVVVQWRGATGIQMHAREFGANYGETGHVSLGASRELSTVSEGRGGYLTSLGDRTATNPLIAEVYTFPTAMKNAGDTVNLTLETEVTEANCGRDVSAQTIQISAGKKLSSQVLTVPVAECDTVGEILVLNNLLQDLTVASK